MNSIKNLKKISLLIFMAMILPYGKLEIPNAFMIIINTGLIFIKGGVSFPGHVFIIICLIGIYLIYFKNKFNVIIGFLLSYLWLIYKIDCKELINSLPVSISVFIYVTISIYTSFKVLKEPSSQK
ncbi:MAG: hypothetical protein COW44_08800 [Flavobacteriaceae bacterium CG17_big_fil_post_rev_8_21_14_2_50_33_15]|nr:MAG: hypothetical protein COW44_08800 [Flavobacteriaceae bacterium CG17_big_fil_post_rev_8_21_14_2_50_33_15]